MTRFRLGIDIGGTFIDFGPLDELQKPAKRGWEGTGTFGWVYLPLAPRSTRGRQISRSSDAVSHRSGPDRRLAFARRGRSPRALDVIVHLGDRRG